MPDRPQTTDLLVLAATARAAAHRADRDDAAPRRDILAHLGLAPRTAAAREVDSRLAELTDCGRLLVLRRHGLRAWSLTDRGRRALARASTVALPESPQHRAWRRAQVLALLELPRLRAALRSDLAEARALTGEAPSEEWFALAERLRWSAWRVGSATYCLREWREPDDGAADIDAAGGGRRNVRLWNRCDS